MGRGDSLERGFMMCIDIYYCVVKLVWRAAGRGCGTAVGWDGGFGKRGGCAAAKWEGTHIGWWRGSGEGLKVGLWGIEGEM